MGPDNPFKSMLEPITCHQAAVEIRKLYGILAHGPTLGAIVASLEGCQDGNHVQPRAAFTGFAAEAALQDSILALCN